MGFVHAILAVVAIGQNKEVNEEGNKTYHDWQELMSKGGSMTNLQMTPEIKQEVVDVCKAITNDLSTEIIDKAVTYRDRVGGFNWERWLCVKELQLCSSTLIHKSDEDEDDEDKDDEQEL